MANADASGEGTVAFITEASDANGNELDFVGGIFDAAKAKPAWHSIPTARLRFNTCL